MNNVNSFDDLLKLGWKRRQVGKNKLYIRPPPSCGVVRQSRDLSEVERVAFGHILFPGLKRSVPSLPPSEPSPSPSPSSVSPPSEVFTPPAFSPQDIREAETVTASSSQEYQRTEVYIFISQET